MLTKSPETKHKRRRQAGFAKRWGRAKPPELPELMKPDGAGYMPLYCAAQWIATCGGTKEINPLDEAIWRKAFKDLLDRLASGDVKVVGERPDGVSEDISGARFASCLVNYPFSDVRFDLIRSKQLCLFSRPYLDDEHWRGGFDDALEDRRGVRWRRLMVLKSDVARYWPFAATLDYLTGEPPTYTPAARPAQPRERTPRAQPQRERARRALNERYPSGAPDRTSVSDAELVVAVNVRIKYSGQNTVSRETILRAAGRLK